MSEAIVLRAVARKEVGKGANRRLRRAELIPAVIYGGRIEPIQVTLESCVIRKILKSESFYSQIVTVDIEGICQQVILKNIQRHPAKELVMHLDFLRVDASRAVTTYIPLHFLNQDTCVGVKSGGAITHTRIEVEVKCLPVDLPKFIEVDMAAVELGDHVRLTNLTLPKNIKLVALLQQNGHNLDLASVQSTRGSKEDESEQSSTNDTE